MITDTELLQTYMWGFNDELDGRKPSVHHEDLKQRAYDLGRLDAVVGDDVSSSDEQSDEQILKRIRNKIKQKN